LWNLLFSKFIILSLVYINKSLLLLFFSPTKYNFIKAKYQALQFVHRLPSKDDDATSVDYTLVSTLPIQLTFCLMDTSLLLMHHYYGYQWWINPEGLPWSPHNPLTLSKISKKITFNQNMKMLLTMNQNRTPFENSWIHH